MSHIVDGVGMALTAAAQAFRTLVVVAVLALGSCTVATGTAIYFAVKAHG